MQPLPCTLCSAVSAESLDWGAPGFVLSLIVSTRRAPPRRFSCAHCSSSPCSCRRESRKSDPGSTKVEDGREKSRFRPSVFLYLSRILAYTETGREMGQVYPGAGREMGEEVSVRICGIPFFNQNILFFIPFLTYT